jgi:hypothetical protein
MRAHQLGLTSYPVLERIETERYFSDCRCLYRHVFILHVNNLENGKRQFNSAV